MTARDAFDRAEAVHDGRTDDHDGPEGCACGVEDVLDSGMCDGCEQAAAGVPWWLPGEDGVCSVLLALAFVGVVVCGVVGQGRL